MLITTASVVILLALLGVTAAEDAAYRPSGRRSGRGNATTSWVLAVFINSSNIFLSSSTTGCKTAHGADAWWDTPKPKPGGLILNPFVDAPTATSSCAAAYEVFLECLATTTTSSPSSRLLACRTIDEILEESMASLRAPAWRRRRSKRRGRSLRTAPLHVANNTFVDWAEWDPPGVDRGLKFHSTDAIIARMDALALAYPGLVSKLVVGDSFLKRNRIVALRISTTPYTNDVTKPEVLLVGTHHAREWISAEVPIGIAEMLCGLYYRNHRVRVLMRRVEWIIVPVVNPDGYDFTMAAGDAQHRFWRKNRRPPNGVDLNRNYPVFYGLPNGASTYPYSETYRGASPSSEPEVVAMERLASNASLMTRIAFYVSFHNFGQDLLWPYGEIAADFSPIDAFMAGIFTYIASTVMPGVDGGRRYSASKASGPYPASGDAVDYMHKTFDSVPSITVELRPTDRFDLPVSDINATVLENLAMVLYYMEYALQSMDNLHEEKRAHDDAAVYRWWLDQSRNARFDAHRVTDLDVNKDSTFDWFGFCDPRLAEATGTSYRIPIALRTATAFEDVSPLGKPYAPGTSETIVDPRTGLSRACRNATDLPSVLGSGGFSRALRVHVRLREGNSTLLTADRKEASLVNVFAAAKHCRYALKPSVGRALAALLSESWPSVPVAVAMDLEGCTNRTWVESPLEYRCAAAFRFKPVDSTAPPDAVDDVFRAVLSRLHRGDFANEPSGAITSLIDASFDTSVSVDSRDDDDAVHRIDPTVASASSIPVYTFIDSPSTSDSVSHLSVLYVGILTAAIVVMLA